MPDGDNPKIAAFQLLGGQHFIPCGRFARRFAKRQPGQVFRRRNWPRKATPRAVVVAVVVIALSFQIDGTTFVSPFPSALSRLIDGTTSPP